MAMGGLGIGTGLTWGGGINGAAAWAVVMGIGGAPIPAFGPIFSFSSSGLKQKKKICKNTNNTSKKKFF